MSSAPFKVLHIIPQLSLGGASRSLIGLGKYSGARGGFRHDVLSVRPVDARAHALAAAARMSVLVAPGGQRVRDEVERADIVQFCFWNTPELYEVLEGVLPAMRAAVWCVVNGVSAPHILTEELVEFADVVVASGASTLALPILNSVSPDRLEVALCGADFARLEGIKPKSHATFNVGYIGTVDFAKMHPDYVAMSAAIEIPEVQFIVCGEGHATDALKRQAADLKAENRFEFRGYVEDICEILPFLDVFGYPLCEGNFSSTELILQEVMYAGIPSVVLPFGGSLNLIVHGETGLVAEDAEDYVRSIHYLHEHPSERARLGRNAATRAREMFGAENSARKFDALYTRLLQRPKCQHRPVGGHAHGTSRVRAGAWALTRSLGSGGANFIKSLNPRNDHEAITAEQAIARSNPVLGDTILHYRNRYVDDGYLHLWAGLVMTERRRPAVAASEFKRAIKRGCDHWRTFWYLAQAAKEAGSSSVADDALRAVRNAVPEIATKLNV